MTIGQRIKQRREELGMTQNELAKKVGYKGKAAISRIETSEGELSSAIILRIAPAIGVSPSKLLEGEEYQHFLSDYYEFDADDVRLIDNYRCLTDDGQRKLENYLYDLLKNPENVLPGVEPYGTRYPFGGGENDH